MVKSLPAVRETWVRSLDREDPLEKEMATHSSILVWKIPWMQEPSQLQSMGLQRVGHDWATSLSLSPFQLKTKLKHYPPTSTRAGPWVRQVGGGGVGTIYPNFLSTIHQVFQNKFLFEPQQAKKKKKDTTCQPFCDLAPIYREYLLCLFIFSHHELQSSIFSCFRCFLTGEMCLEASPL